MVIDRFGNLVTSELSGFATSNVDTQSESLIYTGYIDINGAWYIQMTSVAGTVTTYTFACGLSDYATNWTSRGTLTYSAWNVAAQLFKYHTMSVGGYT